MRRRSNGGGKELRAQHFVASYEGLQISSEVPMADTGTDILVETLLAWEVDTVFGLPGDGINGVIEALRTRQDKIKFIQVRHDI